MAVARMETCEDVGELARELGVRPRCLYKWRSKLEMVEPGQEASRPSTHASAHRKEIHPTNFLGGWKPKKWVAPAQHGAIPRPFCPFCRVHLSLAWAFARSPGWTQGWRIWWSVSFIHTSPYRVASSDRGSL